MFGLGYFWDKSASGNFETTPFLHKQFRNFQKCTRAIYTKSPSQTCHYLYKQKNLFGICISYFLNLKYFSKSEKTIHGYRNRR